MRGLPSILLLVRNVLDKLNNTRARMLDSIYHYDIKIILKSHFLHKRCLFCQCTMDVITFPENL